MIKIPKNDVEKCDAFMMPLLNGVDIANFIKAQENGNFDSLRASTFASKRVFSFDKFKAYVENIGGSKIYLESTPTEQVYVINACDLDELESILFGNAYPIFLQNYDFDNDIYLRNTLIDLETKKQKL